MIVNEKILKHGVGCFDELVDSLTNEEIAEMNKEYIREDYDSDFDFKYCVASAYIKNWLIERIDSYDNGAETRFLFEIYCAM